MLYLTCTMISSADLAHYGVSRAKDLVSMDCGTNEFNGGTSCPYNNLRTRHRKRYNPLALYHSSYWSHCWMDTHFLMYLLRVL